MEKDETFFISLSDKFSFQGFGKSRSMPSPTEILKRIFLFAQLEAVAAVTTAKLPNDEADEKGPLEVDDEVEDEDEAPHSLGEMIAIRKFVKDVSSAASRFSSRFVQFFLFTGNLKIIITNYKRIQTKVRFYYL